MIMDEKSLIKGRTYKIDSNCIKEICGKAIVLKKKYLIFQAKYLLTEYLSRMHDFPTPEFPIISSFNKTSLQ